MIPSSFGFEETIERENAAINAQDDTMHFGAVDFQPNVRELGFAIAPPYLILLGGPGPEGADGYITVGASNYKRRRAGLD